MKIYLILCSNFAIAHCATAKEVVEKLKDFGCEVIESTLLSSLRKDVFYSVFCNVNGLKQQFTVQKIFVKYNTSL